MCVGVKKDSFGPFEQDKDWKIAVGLGCGLTEPAIGEYAGVSSRTVANKKKAQHIRFLAGLVEEVSALSRASIRDEINDRVAVTRQQLRDQYEERLYAALAAIDRGLESADPKVALAAAKEILDRSEGKPVQTNVNKVEGEIGHRHIYELSESTMTAFEHVAALVGRGKPQQYIEGEVVE